MSYIGLNHLKDSESPHLGGNMAEGDPFSFAPNVWNYVIERFSITSVLDLGSGLGHSSEYLFKKGMKVLAIDGMDENIENALYPTLQVDLTKTFVSCKVDFVHCQEVVEHIDEEFIQNVIQSLTCGKIILLTNALPGQGGYHHVNEQQVEYWIDHLRCYNCHVLAEDTHRIRELAQKDGARYLAATGTLYANRNRL